MKIKFLGATGEVTGSCTWCILDNGVQFLVDCGMFQGFGEELRNDQFPFDPAQIKFVLLTHAHADHCGRIPLLYKQGFKGKVYCTSATKDLTLLNLRTIAGESVLFDKPDLKNIQFETYNEHENAFSKNMPISAAYGFYVNFERTSHMLGAAAVNVTWRTDADEEKRIFFSGDVGNNREGNCYQPLLKRNHIARNNVDYFVLESTYGSRPAKEQKFKDPVERIKALNGIISDDQYREVVIPCFSIQRTQDLLFDLFCTLAYCFPPEEKVLVVVDSPSGLSACKFFSKHLLRDNDGKNCYLNSHCAEDLSAHFEEDIDARTVVDEMMEMLLKERVYGLPDGLGSYAAGKNFDIRPYVHTVKCEEGEGACAGCREEKGCERCAEEKAYQDAFDKKIILTSSGMCHAGAVLKHLKKLTDEEVAFVLTGYQGTPNGRLLQKCVNREEILSGEEPLYLGKVKTEVSEGKFAKKDRFLPRKYVKAGVYSLGDYYSGHADRENLLRYLFENDEEKGLPEEGEGLKPVTVFLNHGDDGARHGLKQAIEERAAQGRKPNDMRRLGQVIVPPANTNFYDLNKEEWVDNIREMIENQHCLTKQLNNIYQIVSATAHPPRILKGALRIMEHLTAIGIYSPKKKKQKGNSAESMPADKNKPESTS